jgi:hypothetical protein
MQRRPPELGSYQIDDIPSQRTAYRLGISAGILGQVQNPMRCVDQDAGRRRLFQSPRCAATSLIATLGVMGRCIGRSFVRPVPCSCGQLR